MTFVLTLWRAALPDHVNLFCFNIKLSITETPGFSKVDLFYGHDFKRNLQLLGMFKKLQFHKLLKSLHTTFSNYWNLKLAHVYVQTVMEFLAQNYALEKWNYRINGEPAEFEETTF